VIREIFKFSEVLIIEKLKSSGINRSGRCTASCNSVLQLALREEALCEVRKECKAVACVARVVEFEICAELMRDHSMSDYSKSIGICGLVFE